MITVTIDDKVIKTEKPKFLIELARENGIDIPNLCYDKNLEVVSACRLCLVEVEGSKKLLTACSTLAKDNMVVHTKTERLIKHRKKILQLLLDSHPNDCLTCQKSGECQLQKYSYEYGVKFRDHDGARRGNLIDNTSPYIFRDDSKCILCGKCVRTCNVMDDRKILNFSNRGYETKVNLDVNDTFESSYCISCNRCVVACPVGALMDKRAMHYGRNWEIETKKITCKTCDYGCEFELIKKNGKNVALRASKPDNGRPLCLKGRLTTELLNVDNPKKPYRKMQGEFIETSWTDILGVDKILAKIEKIEK